MLEKEKAIDAVLIATPDHLHAYVSILAMKAGKHVYCEKPLTHNIREARLVARVAKDTGVATQMGNHGRSSEGHRETVEWLTDGAIGAVKEVHAWSGSPRTAGSTWPGEGPATKPAGLNWDLWLGPAAERPYSGQYAPFVWRWVWDFGSGTMPDMAPHHFDPAFNALGLDAPVTVKATASFVDPQVTLGSNLVTYQYDARGARGPLTLFWYDNGLRPPTPLGIDPDDPLQRLGEGDNGLMLVGEKGILTCAGWSGMPRLLPMELHRSYKRPPKTLPRVAGHHADWLQACKGGTPACSNFDYGARLTEFVLLGALALRTGKVIKWDAANMKVTNNVPEAQAIIDGSYRKGWEVG
jgi:predicted dehydrogenase